MFSQVIVIGVIKEGVIKIFKGCRHAGPKITRSEIITQFNMSDTEFVLYQLNSSLLPCFCINTS